MVSKTKKNILDIDIFWLVILLIFVGLKSKDILTELLCFPSFFFVVLELLFRSFQ